MKLPKKPRVKKFGENVIQFYFGELSRWFLSIYFVSGLVAPFLLYPLVSENAGGMYLFIWVIFWVIFGYGYIEGRHYEYHYGDDEPPDDPDGDKYRRREFHDIM